MKQKTLILLMMLLIIALLGLGNYLYIQRGQQMQVVQQNQQINRKQIADLNDRLVAVARQQQNGQTNANGHGLVNMQLNQSQQVQLGQQQRDLRQLQRQWSLTALQLTQSYLRQAQYDQAQQLLLQLQQNIIESQSVLADPFNHTLLQTLKIDQLTINQEAQRQHQVQASLDQVLAQVQQQLNLMSVQAPHSLLNTSGQDKTRILSAAWFKQLFVLQRADASTSQHMLDRSFICKQASLNVAMARLALANNSQVGFSSNMTEAVGQLNLLADPGAVQISQQLSQLKTARLPAMIELTSLTLLSGQKRAS